MHGLVNRMQLNINSPSQSRPWPQEGTSWVGHNVNNWTSSPGAEYLKELKMPVKRVKDIMRVSQDPCSLETPVGEEDDNHLGDFIPDDKSPAPADMAFQVSLKEQLMEVMSTLSRREAKVLMMRFGLEDGRPKTLEDVGKEFNVTRERIRQIEAKALRKLRHPARIKQLKDFLD